MLDKIIVKLKENLKEMNIVDLEYIGLRDYADKDILAEIEPII